VPSAALWRPLLYGRINFVSKELEKYMKAHAYLRVSGQGQVEKDGFTRQLETIQKYAAANGITIAKVYREEGVTGKTDMEGRPALQEMMLDMLSNGVRMILIERLDRLARFLMYQESILQDLKRKGIEVVSVTEPEMCSEDPTRILMRQVLGAFFEYERTCIVNKTRAARERIRASGKKCEGKKAFGFHSDKPEEKQTLTLMLALSKHYSAAWIALELNKRGIKPRSGKKWHPNSVARILNRRSAA
jgi:DNA invertase Pin-like site-specific DNA recombinase